MISAIRINPIKILTAINSKCVSSRYLNTGMKVCISEEVRTALHENKPVVALESTIVTHGMPYPENLSTALTVEGRVRSADVTPATVAVVEGKICVGLNSTQISQLADVAACSKPTLKVSRRDLGYAMANKLNGGTTVATTMMAAHAAGIPIFVTGGVGGVHRDVSQSMDVSADLRELGRTPMAVVCAGVKSILDIARTLEYLETEGVCVATYGTSKTFPAFLTLDSGLKSPYNVTDAQQAAHLIHENLNIQNSVLMAVPIPEEHAMDQQLVDQSIQIALDETKERNIAGKNMTPYLLKRLNELTSGLSLKSNIALIHNNADVGANIALHLANIKRNNTKDTSGSPTIVVNKSFNQKKNFQNIVVVGGINVDVTARISQEHILHNGATYPGQVGVSYGGVGRNLASALTYLNGSQSKRGNQGNPPRFISTVGNDNYGKLFIDNHKFMDLCGVQVNPQASSAVYCALVDNKGDLIYGIGDFNIHSTMDVAFIKKQLDSIVKAGFMVIDGNIPAETISYICSICKQEAIPVWFEPTDLHHANKPIEGKCLDEITYCSPNINELKSMHKSLYPAKKINEEVKTEFSSLLYQVEKMSLDIVSKFPNLILVVTMASHGLMLIRNGELTAHHSAIVRSGVIDSVSGAGDCLAAGMIDSLMGGSTLQDSIDIGIRCADISLDYSCAVPADLGNKVNEMKSYEASN